MSQKTATLLNRLKGDGVFAKEKDTVVEVNVRLDPQALRDNIAALLQVLLRQRTKCGTKNQSLLTEDMGGCCTALANRVVSVMATCIHARANGKKCDDGCCAAMMAMPRLLAELCNSTGAVEATTLAGARRRFIPVLPLNGGDCGIPTGWDETREEAAFDALKNGKPALPMVDVSADIACATPVSSWWLMQRHGQEIYSPVLPLSELTPLDLIGPILMINPFADSVALFTDGPAQVHKGLRNKMDAVAVPATCPDFMVACAAEVVSVKVAQRVVIDRNFDGSIVVLPAAPASDVRKSQSGLPPPPPPPQPAAGSRDASSPLFLSSPSLTFSPAAAAIASGEPPEPSGSSAASGPPTARPSLTGQAWPPRASMSQGNVGGIARVSSTAARGAPGRAPSFAGSASGGGGGGTAVVIVPRGDFGTPVPRVAGGQTAGDAGVAPAPGSVDDQTWLVFVRHYFYRALLTKDATKELTWETFIQGCF